MTRADSTGGASTNAYDDENNNNHGGNIGGNGLKSLNPADYSSLNDYIKNTYGSLGNCQSQPFHAQDSAEISMTLCKPNSSSEDGTVEDPENQESRYLLSKQTSNLSFNSNNNVAYSTDEGWTLRRLALELSLYLNLLITLAKLIAYIDTLSLSVLAALLDSVLDVVSQYVLNYTEKHSSMQRSSAFYPAGASRLEPIGVLTCAALMGMASFEVLKESGETLIWKQDTLEDKTLEEEMLSFWSMVAIILIKFFLYFLCERARYDRSEQSTSVTSKRALQLADPTLEALAQDHWNDMLSNGVASVALILTLYSPKLWFLDPVGAILISVYIIWSWFETGKEQIEQLTGKSAPNEFIEELLELAHHFDQRMQVDTCRAYHFGPKFLVELEVVMPQTTLLKESHDLGMELQYEIEAQEDVERCFVHIDYETRDYDEHVVSKVPELREQLLRRRAYKSHASV
eukprot:scaffold22569_cov116-Cylindrotheca_fusiformis.AAC.5